MPAVSGMVVEEPAIAVDSSCDPAVVEEPEPDDDDEDAVEAVDAEDPAPSSVPHAPVAAASSTIVAPTANAEGRRHDMAATLPTTHRPPVSPARPSDAL